jgi:hypothetical protein
MNTFRTSIGRLLAFLHNLWAVGPLPGARAEQLWPAVQAALLVAALALWAFIQGFGWYVPADPSNIHLWLAELNNAAVLAFAVLVPIVQLKLWPALQPYLMTLFNLNFELPMAGSRAYKPTRVVVLWQAAA